MREEERKDRQSENEVLMSYALIAVMITMRGHHGAEVSMTTTKVTTMMTIMLTMTTMTTINLTMMMKKLIMKEACACLHFDDNNADEFDDDGIENDDEADDESA